MKLKLERSFQNEYRNTHLCQEEAALYRELSSNLFKFRLSLHRGRIRSMWEMFGTSMLCTPRRRSKEWKRRSWVTFSAVQLRYRLLKWHLHRWLIQGHHINYAVLALANTQKKIWFTKQSVRLPKRVSIPISFLKSVSDHWTEWHLLGTMTRVQTWFGPENCSRSIQVTVIRIYVSYNKTFLQAHFRLCFLIRRITK